MFDLMRKSEPLLFELALVLVRFDHVASFIVNANRGVPVNGCRTSRSRLHFRLHRRQESKNSVVFRQR
jgi:hypothetical protein